MVVTSKEVYILDPEIIGVRGMVCGGDRSTTIRTELVEKAMMMLR